jgi:hypothetical protein
MAPPTYKGETMEEPSVETLAETKNFEIWQADEPDGETTYHLELGIVTLHLFQEEWEEFLEVVRTAESNAVGS